AICKSSSSKVWPGSAATWLKRAEHIRCASFRPAMATLFLKRGRANPLWHGHPWVYSGAVGREEGGYEPGDVVEVRDSDGRYIGRGFANPRSQIRVRMVTRKDEPVDDAL